MVKPKQLSVALFEEKDVYLPGDEVTGQLEIHLEEEMEMKEVNVIFSGKAHVAWNEGKTNYAQTERFFYEAVVVHGQESSDTSGKVSLPAGFHKFPFQFCLPKPLASSYQDPFGFIRYSVKGEIVKPWQINNKTRKVITVLDTLDLNHLSNMLAPSGGSGSKTLCCWCCASGAIEGEVRIDRRGYVPGEWIIANGTLENHSSSAVRQTSLEFVKIVTYYTTYRRKTEIKSLSKQIGPSCKRGGTVNLTNVKLQIPPTPPSEFTHCSIIDIQYAVMLMGHLRTCAINLRVFAPLVVGTVPLASLPQYQNQGSEQPADIESTSLPPTSTTTYGMQGPPPPSYALATSESFNARGNQDTDQDDPDYKPKYTYYNWDQSAFNYN